MEGGNIGMIFSFYHFILFKTPFKSWYFERVFIFSKHYFSTTICTSSYFFPLCKPLTLYFYETIIDGLFGAGVFGKHGTKKIGIW
jgi:hypothetical protein